MASPMQDAAVSSSGSGVRSPGPDTSESEDLTCNTTVQKVLYYKAAPCQVKTVQASGNCCSWMTDFNEDMSRLAHCSNFQLFIQSLAVYAKNVANDAVIYSLDTSKLALLRSHMSNVLLYYHFHWRSDTKFQRMDDHCTYLQYMSDIMIPYVNLELRFLGTSVPSQNKFIVKLLNELCLYLDCSEEHIFKVLLKSDLVSEQFKTICSPIIRRLFMQAISNEVQLTSIMYMRYIITFKLWRSIYHTKIEEKEIREIESLALQLLGSNIAPSCFDAVDFFPRPLERCINKTLWYLNTTSFDLETTIENFLRFEEDSYPHQHEPVLAKRCRNQYHLKIYDNTKRNPHSHSKSKPKIITRKRVNNEEILFVDLTEESDTRNKVKSVQSREIRWLKNFKENPKKQEFFKFSNERLVMDPSSVPSCIRPKAATECLPNEDFNKLFMINMPDLNDAILNNSRHNGDVNILHDSYDIFYKSDIYNPTFFDEYNTENYDLPLNDTINWLKKMPTSDDKPWEEKYCTTITSHEEIEHENTKTSNKINENASHHGRKRFGSALKTEECSPSKIKNFEFFSSNNDGSIPWLDQDIKLEEPCADELPTPFIEKRVEPTAQLNLPFRSQNNTLHQMCDENTHYSRLQALVDCVSHSDNTKIITVFDSGNPILRELMSKKIKPTASHYFIRLLCDKGLLLRHYTENDGELERLAGVPSGKCIDFSGKDASRSSFSLPSRDTSQAGLLIFFTNSLSSVSKWFQGKHPRSFIIQEKTVETENMSPSDFLKLNSIPQDDFKFEGDSNTNVIQAETCDKFCPLLIRLLGWNEDFKRIQQQFEKAMEIC